MRHAHWRGQSGHGIRVCCCGDLRALHVVPRLSLIAFIVHSPPCFFCNEVATGGLFRKEMLYQLVFAEFDLLLKVRRQH